MIGLLAVTAVFAAALVWFQFFAFYERDDGVEALAAAGARVPVATYEGIDAASSPLKLRGCFRADPAAFAAAAAPAPAPTPLNAPFWFGCFDARTLSLDLAAGRATAYALATDEPAGFDLVAALYPDGRGFVWRQLNDRFAR
jgi:hypothetical protein